ncbi:MAG TPA: carbohydrate ABC transporter permease [Mycobacteriales bacterium]|nr:carbohydrate ABC transporter permease [Mycobacteriales bacterium]
MSVATNRPVRTDTGPPQRADRPGRRPERRDRISALVNVISHGCLVVWALLVTFPLLWMLVTSLKSDQEIFSSPWRPPSTLHFDNFARARAGAEIGQYFLDTVVVVAGGVTLTLLLSSMAAYALARYPFPGSRIFYYLFIAGMTFPVFLAIIPLFFIAKNLGLTNSLPGLMLIYAAYSLPFSVFFLTAFFRTLPDSLAEAAFIDGCGHWGTFFRVMLPLAKPGLISIGIFNVLGQWNQYLLPLVLEDDPKKYMLAQGLASLAVRQGYKSDWSALFAGLTISMLPVLVFYVIFQRQIRAGLTTGALK